MPAIQKIYTSWDGQKVNVLQNFLLNPITTVDRMALGLTLTNANNGLTVIDMNENIIYFWSFTQWVAAGGLPSILWGSITGNILNQLDLQEEFATKLSSINAQNGLSATGGTVVLGGPFLYNTEIPLNDFYLFFTNTSPGEGGLKIGSSSLNTGINETGTWTLPPLLTLGGGKPTLSFNIDDYEDISGQPWGTASIVFRSQNPNMPNMTESLWGQYAGAGLEFHYATTGGPYTSAMEFWLGYTDGTTGVILGLYGKGNHFAGTRANPSVEVPFCINIGQQWSDYSGFGSTSGSFNMDANNAPINIWNLPINPLVVTASDALLVIKSNGNIYSENINATVIASTLTGFVAAPGTITSADSILTALQKLSFAASSDVTSFNGRTGAVTLISSDVTGALGFTPYNATNPSNYIALTALSAGLPLLYNNATGVFTIQQASGSQNGYLSSTDWTTFNNKQAAGSYITALTGDVTASGPGAVAATLATVNSNIGSFGDATDVAAFTVNAKGLITAASSVPISFPVISVFGRTGAITTQSGDYTTSLVTEGTNLYFTNARGIAATLTGYVSGAGTISASDSILTAIEKLNGNIAALTTGVSSVNTSVGSLTFSPSTGAVIGDINLAHSNSFTAAQTIIKTAVGLGNTTALLLQNTTSAAAGSSNQQYSPSLQIEGQGWNTSALASQAVDFKIYESITQGNPPLGSLLFAYSENGGAYSTLYTFDSLSNVIFSSGNMLITTSSAGTGQVSLSNSGNTAPGFFQTVTSGGLYANTVSATAQSILTLGLYPSLTVANTSGTMYLVNFELSSFAPTSGTGGLVMLNVAPTINQTGGASGITRGIYINPTTTAAADWRAIEIINGKSIFQFVGVGGLNPTGNGYLQIAANTSTNAQMILSSGTTNVTSPVGGMLWWNGTNLYFNNGVTNKDLLVGTTYSADGTTLLLTGTTFSINLANPNTWTGIQTFNPTVSSSAGLGREHIITGTLTATANNDVLIGLDIAPTYTNGAFTGVENAAIRAKGDIIPSSNDIYNLGTNSLAWGNVFTGNLTTVSISGFGDIAFYNASSVLIGKWFNATGNLLIQDGGTFIDHNARLQLAAASSTDAQIYLASGTTNVSSPSAGMLWWNGVNLYFNNGTTNLDLLLGGNLLFTNNIWTGIQTLPSPVLTGVPVAPTAAAGTNTTQVATTQFVQTAITSNIGPIINISRTNYNM